MSEQKLKTLYSTLNTMMGEGMGNFLLDCEIKRLNLTGRTMSEEEFELLTQSLRNNFVLMLGKDSTEWLFEEVNKSA
jgi:hypothetical protein